jgi:ribonuclease H / adenosylcobalamin/alpha-ribazole phosphatase
VTAVTILLLRHGAHDLVDRVLCGRTTGGGLSERGRAQAAALGLRLAGRRLTALWSSPVRRARETAEIVAVAAGREVQVDEALHEIEFGAWTGRTFAELDPDPDWRRWNAARDAARPPGGESMEEVRERVAGWFERALARYGGETIAAVSHADVIKAGVAHALGLSIRFHDRFEVAPGSITALAVWPGGAKILGLNEVPHE